MTIITSCVFGGDIREQTLRSTAPYLINEEGSLIERSIRDLYDRDMEEVLVNEEAAYRAAKETMRMLMPSHAKRVKLYKEKAVPLFREYGVEQQLDSIFAPRVDLRSGGYLIINQTEALVAIDVNSGRATKERSIEETAVKTNLEAAEEIAWQLRLRDLAGLVVIDFIDMNERRNQNRVESHFKEALKTDRARTQVGKLSMFGLLELSRQRLRPSLAEVSTAICPSCKGSGAIRSVGFLGLRVLRILEDQSVAAGSNDVITAFLPEGVSSYMLNEKRARIVDIEQRYHVRIVIVSEAGMIEPDYRVEIESSGRVKTTVGSAADPSAARPASRRSSPTAHGVSKDSQEAADAVSDDRADQRKNPEEEGERSERRGRRRGKRGGRRRRPQAAETDTSLEAISNPSPLGEEEANDNQEQGNGSVIPETGDHRAAADPEKKDSPREKKPRRRRAASRKSTRSKATQSRTAQSQSSSPAPPQSRASADNSESTEGSSGQAPAPAEKKTGWWQGLLG